MPHDGHAVAFSLIDFPHSRHATSPMRVYLHRLGQWHPFATRAHAQGHLSVTYANGSAAWVNFTGVQILPDPAFVESQRRGAAKL